MPGPSVRDLTSDEDRRRRIVLGEGAPQQTTADDISWAVQHALGYGSVDAPSPFGHNRDTFMAEHPNYSGGYYNPSSGFYDAPTEAPPGWINTEPQRGSTGAGLSNHTQDMGSLPSGGNSEYADPQVQMSFAQDQSMPGAQQSEPPGGSSEPTLGQLMEMISTYVENSSTSNGT